MIWGIKDNEKIRATPKGTATCSMCKNELVPKCGVIKIWHWAHKSLNDCDNWHESESEWHLNWKNEFPKEQQEITIKKYNTKLNYDGSKKYINEIENHRADIKTPLRVIELQNSPISSKEINERENFYGKMVWLLNGKTLCKGMKMRKENGIIKFRWYHPPKSWWIAKKPIYIDFSDIQQEENKWVGENDYIRHEGYWKHLADKMNREIFLIKKLYDNVPCGGWGILIKKEEFLNGR